VVVRTPWQEAIELRQRWAEEDRQLGRRGLHERRADEVEGWFADITGEADRYFERSAGGDPGDPREALIRVLAVTGAAIDAMGPEA